MVAIKNEFEKKQKLLHQQILHQQAYVQQQQSIAAVIGKQQQQSSQLNQSLTGKPVSSAAFSDSTAASNAGHGHGHSHGQTTQSSSSDSMSSAFVSSESTVMAKDQESHSQTKDLDSLNLEEKARQKTGCPRTSSHFLCFRVSFSVFGYLNFKINTNNNNSSNNSNNNSSNSNNITNNSSRLKA